MTVSSISMRRAVPWLIMIVASAVLGACTQTGEPTASAGTVASGSAGTTSQASSPGMPSRKFKVGKPYQVEGQWYYPGVDLSYNERGVASWYGPNFHGKRTANGETFDMSLISAAHKTLPLPSVVRVTNLENGRSLVIRVNDRGPFVRGRIIDLSRHAAELLGFTAKGTAMVQVRLLPEESRRAALEAGATKRDMLAFGPPPPNASPSIPVTVEALSPAEGVDVTATPTAAAGSVGAQLPNSGSQTASNAVALSTSNSLPATSSPTAAPPPYGGMTAVVAANAPTWTGNATAPASTAGQPTANAATSPVIDVKTLPVRDKVDQVAIHGKPQIFIQAGAFREFVNANRLRARLTGLGQPVMVSQVYVTNQPFFRVRLGPLRSVEDADTALARLVALGYPEAQIVVD